VVHIISSPNQRDGFLNIIRPIHRQRSPVVLGIRRRAEESTIPMPTDHIKPLPWEMDMNRCYREATDKVRKVAIRIVGVVWHADQAMLLVSEGTYEQAYERKRNELDTRLH
jgi:hypothetical protein